MSNSLPLSCRFTPNQWAQLAEMQDEQNILLAGDNWKTTDNREIPYYRAILVEQGEAIDHYGFKWWKKQEPNLSQFFIEIVDIFHFALSDRLRVFAQANPHIEDPKDLYNQFGNYMDKAVPKHVSLPAVGYFATTARRDCEVTPLDLLDVLAYNTLQTGAADIKVVCLCFDSIGKTAETVFNTYVAKYCLNKFRNHNGYKTGTYIKIWDGQEDNVHLEQYIDECAEKGQAINSDDAYAFLAQKYKEIA